MLPARLLSQTLRNHPTLILHFGGKLYFIYFYSAQVRRVLAGAGAEKLIPIFARKKVTFKELSFADHVTLRQVFTYIWEGGTFLMGRVLK